MPEDVAREFEKDKLSKWIGTGPFKFVEHLPDRHVRMARWDKYTPLEAPASFQSGKRVAWVDEVRFMPVPEPSVRVDGVGTNEYHFAESLPPDFYDTVKGQPNVSPIISKPYYWFSAHFNNK